MYLRKLEKKDAPYMLEWMHEKDVVKHLRADFAGKTIDDCYDFIARKENDSIHFAICNDTDEYMGTVSLKHIDNNAAEFGITVRSKAMGKGYAHYGMNEVLKYAFDVLNLKCVYWCVNSNNDRALRFYDKRGYRKVDPGCLCICRDYLKEEISQFIWYRVLIGELSDSIG